MSRRAFLTLKEGFEGRVWLNHAEWETYRRRVAVRFPQKLRAEVASRQGELCFTCGQDLSTNPERVQLAHRVPFKIGVVDWGLTPDWLDSAANLCLAHVGKCNDGAELTNSEIVKHLRALGLDLANSPAVASGEINLASGSDNDVVEFRPAAAGQGKK